MPKDPLAACPIFYKEPSISQQLSTWMPPYMKNLWLPSSLTTHQYKANHGSPLVQIPDPNRPQASPKVPHNFVYAIDRYFPLFITYV